MVARGMLVADMQACTSALSQIGYYRLKGYWRQFRIREEVDGELVIHEDLIPGIKFDDVLNLYHFDRKFRLQVFDAIERIEVGLRFHIGHYLGAIDLYALANEALFKDFFLQDKSADLDSVRSRSEYQELMFSVDKALQRSHSPFVEHHFENRAGKFPIWVTTEVLTFKDLHQILRGLKDKHLNAIAANVGLVDGEGDGIGGVLLNWVEVLVKVRNICAHHGRLWDIPLGSALKVTHLKRFSLTRHIYEYQGQLKNSGVKHFGYSTSRMYGPLVVINFLNRGLGLGRDWDKNIRTTILEIPIIADTGSMGFPINWIDQEIWCD